MISTATAQWEGTLKYGSGSINLQKANAEFSIDAASRFESGSRTTPEELLAGAEAGCFSMALAHNLEEAGYSPEKVETTAKTFLEKTNGGFVISRIDIFTRVQVTGIDLDEFMETVERTKSGCPVSRALAGVKIFADAELTAAT